MEKVLDFVGEYNLNKSIYNEFADKINYILNTDADRIIFDFHECKWFHASLTSVLGGMISICNKNNKNVLPELETMKVDIKNIDEVTSYTGLKTNDGIESIVVSEPLITAQAYSVAIVKVKDNADVEKIKQEMLDNIDMRRWICVSAEQLYITNSGNVIFSVMADKDVAKAVYNDFKKYVNNNIGKELEKSNDEEK